MKVSEEENKMFIDKLDELVHYKYKYAKDFCKDIRYKRSYIFTMEKWNKSNVCIYVI